MFFPISAWFASFLLTLAVEAPIVLLGGRGAGSDLPRLAVIIVAANLATHLAVWYVFTQLLLYGTPAYLVAAETWAVAGETALYWAAIRGLGARRALGLALAANAVSFVVGSVAAALLPRVFG